MLTYKPPRIPLANLPTPFRLLKRWHQEKGGPRIWVKQDDCTGSAQTGNKLRKLEYVVAEALDKGCDTLITCGGVQSNHCRATAIVGAQLGLKVHLLLRGAPEPESDGNLLLDLLAGAEISVYDNDRYLRESEALFAHWCDHYRQQGRKPFVIPTGASDEIGLWGYLTAAEELLQDFAREGISPGALVSATGSGGTQAGLTLGMQLLDSRIPVYGIAVCDSEHYFNNKVREDVARWAARWGEHFDADSIEKLRVNTLGDYIGPGYAQGYPELYECIRLLARIEGLILDPVYTGKAFYGMLKEIEQGRFQHLDDIVFVHTGGIFGLFPQRDALF